MVPNYLSTSQLFHWKVGKVEEGKRFERGFGWMAWEIGEIVAQGFGDTSYMASTTSPLWTLLCSTSPWTVLNYHLYLLYQTLCCSNLSTVHIRCHILTLHCSTSPLYRHPLPSALQCWALFSSLSPSSCPYFLTPKAPQKEKRYKGWHYWLQSFFICLLWTWCWRSFKNKTRKFADDHGTEKNSSLFDTL